MGILDTLKDAVTVVQKAGNIELYKLVLDLQREALEMVEELRTKEAHIHKLEAALELRGKMVFRGSVYYQSDEQDNLVDGPFCPKCFDVDGLQCRVIRSPRMIDGIECLKCRNPFVPELPVIWDFSQEG
jgi:hypothetical protein